MPRACKYGAEKQGSDVGTPHCEPHDKGRIFRDTSRRWEGPFDVTRIVRYSVWVTVGNKGKELPTTEFLPIQTRERDYYYQDLIFSVVRDEKGPTIAMNMESWNARCQRN